MLILSVRMALCIFRYGSSEAMDHEVAQATHTLSRQSSLYTPEDDLSVDSESDRSSPTTIL